MTKEEARAFRTDVLKISQSRLAELLEMRGKQSISDIERGVYKVSKTYELALKYLALHGPDDE